MSSGGFFRTETLGGIRFFWPFNHIGVEHCLVKVALATLFQTSIFGMFQSPQESLLHFLILSAYLFARMGRKVGLDESEVGSVEFKQLPEHIATS